MAVHTGAFRRDIKRAQKRGKEMMKLRELLKLLLAGAPLPDRYKDHPLQGGLARIPGRPH